MKTSRKAFNQWPFRSQFDAQENELSKHVSLIDKTYDDLDYMMLYMYIYIYIYTVADATVHQHRDNVQQQNFKSRDNQPIRFSDYILTLLQTSII